VWIVVEPGHRTDAVAAVLSRSNIDFLHITGPGESTASLRMHALRYVLRCTQAPTTRWDLISRTHARLSSVITSCSSPSTIPSCS
jgi:hypothetical protein